MLKDPENNDMENTREESDFYDSFSITDLIERGTGRGHYDVEMSFKNRIALQFLNDYPINDTN